MLAVLVNARLFEAADSAILAFVQTPHERWMDVVSSLISVFGHAEIVGAVALGVLIARLRAGRRDWWAPGAVAVFVALELLGKVVITQPTTPEELYRGIDFVPGFRPGLDNSFPSGHVGRWAFLVVALRWPSWLGALAVAIMALTRVYLAEHWPMDVIGGILLGYGIAALTLTVLERTSRRST